MLILLNEERVYAEILELGRVRMAAALEVPPTAVSAKWGVREGQRYPMFDVDTEVCAMGERRMEDAFRFVLATLSGEFKWRHEGLRQRRD